MIEDWIEQNIDSNVKYTNNPYEIHICCPVCGETRYRLYINLKDGLIYCHNCQFKGTLVNLVRYIDGSSIGNALKIIKEMKGNISLPINVGDSVSEKLISTLYRSPPVKRAIPLPDEYQKILSSNNLVAKKAIRYLKGRGITETQMLKYNIGICATGEYKNRIIIPITQEGVLKFWVARAISPDERLKEKSPSNEKYQYSKSEVIFNLDNAVKKYNAIVISEGIFDALSWGDIGVSLLGKVLYDSQLQLILDYREFLTQGIYIAIDADAKDNVISIAELLKPFFPIKIIDIPEEFDDPNKYLVTHSRSEMWDLISNAKSYEEFSIVRRKLHIF